jgi:hypothetical protein
MEQRLTIKFCFKAGKSATETLQMVNAAYGDQALSLSNVFRWYGPFRDGREDMKTTPEVAGLQSVAITTMSRRFPNCCFKTVIFC